MLEQTHIEAFVNRFIKVIPKDMEQMRTDLEKQFRLILSATFSKMDIVSREEFDIQSLLLQRTRERLEEIAKQVDSLERAAQQARERS